MGIQTPDLIVKAELGRYPIMGNIIKLCYGYWQHILKANTSSLVHKALIVSINMDRNGIDTYYSRIKSILAVLNEKQNYPRYAKKKRVSQALYQV